MKKLCTFLKKVLKKEFRLRKTFWSIIKLIVSTQFTQYPLNSLKKREAVTIPHYKMF